MTSAAWPARAGGGRGGASSATLFNQTETCHGIRQHNQVSRALEQGGDIVVLEHWDSSGFANTDLDLQLKKRGIHKLIVMGLIAHTCVEATVRYAAELGYEVTAVRDATADYSDRHMQAALVTNLPNYASAIVTTAEIRAALSAAA